MNDRTLILGLGNPLRGDDGAGKAVIDALEKETLPSEVELVDGGTPGLESVLLWQGYDRVLIVDAAQMGLSPGEWRRFSMHDAVLKRSATALTGTLHAVGLAEAIALGEALDALPQELLIFGIEPQQVAWAPGLSRAVETAVAAVCSAICLEVEKPPLAERPRRLVFLSD